MDGELSLNEADNPKLISIQDWSRLGIGDLHNWNRLLSNLANTVERIFFCVSNVDTGI